MKKKIEKKKSKAVKTKKAEAQELSDRDLNEVVGGRDAAGGLSTGSRMHKPFTVTQA